MQKHRPILHFAPQKNWMNDPNGLVYFEGEYHLFYQYHPHDTVWGPMHWGHAVSKDMVKWEELDIALFPDENGTIFSGSIVVDWQNTSGFFPENPGLVAIFTHHLDDAQGNSPIQTQSLAYSIDKGRTWTKYDGNPVLGHESKVDFRDPKVFWHNETSKWVMSLATGQTISFYSSANLIDWQFESEFGDGSGSHEGVWECPDLFKLKVEGSNEEKWVLFVSIGDNAEFDMGSRTQYFLGSFDGSVFTSDHDSTKWLDFGKDNYAGVSFSDIPTQDGRRIYLGWMSNWRYANQVPTSGWRSQMTLPRELSIRNTGDGLKVVQYFVRELDAYSSQKLTFADTISNEVKDYEIKEAAIDLSMAIKYEQANQIDVVLHHTEKQYTTIEFDVANNTVKFDRKHSGMVDFSEMFPLDQVMTWNPTKKIQLRLILDSSSVELLLNDGEYSLTNLVYPDHTIDRISVRSLDGEINTSGTISVLK